MAKGGKSGGKPGGNNNFTFAILGLDDGSDSGISNSDDLTNFTTGFTLTGTIDPSIGSFTLFINGDPYTVTNIDDISGIWNFTYQDLDLDDGTTVDGTTILVEASYTTIHPKNGKVQTKSADPYSFQIDSYTPTPSMTEIGGVLSGQVEPGAQIIVYRGGAIFDDTILANANGDWSLDLGGVTGSFTAEAIDAAGNKSALSGPYVVGTSNSPASISGDYIGAVIEDVSLSDSGSLTVIDTDAGEDALQAMVGAVGDNGYGSFNIQAGGTWTYTLDNGLSVVQSLGEGATLEDTITVLSADGSASQVITVTITGTNDEPIITGNFIGAVTEDGTLTTGGTVTVTDADAGESSLQAVIGAGDRGYGTFDVQANGSWTYELDNSNIAVQALALGATLTDTIIVNTADGTPTAITVTITGTNDVPTISGDTEGVVVEDSTPTPTTTGFLVANDPDTGESNFQSQTDVLGQYGSFTINGTGGWSYILDNSKVQELAEGETRIDSFVVTSVDGTGTETVTITITGTNDLATVTGNTSGNVTEDGTLIATGILTVTDVDSGENSAQSVPLGTFTSSGYGTYQIQSNGTWTYTLNNSLAAVQALGVGETLFDEFTVTSADGSDFEIVTITIHGTNETQPPSIDSFTPSDPLYSEQWHLGMLGDIERIWAEFTGAGVLIGIYDDGIEYSHVDLDDNYVDMTGSGLPDPYPTNENEAKHGTAVAGVIAAEANGLGTVGVAFNASISGVNIFSGAADINAGDKTGFYEASAKQYLFDIVNHSWGAAPVFLNDEFEPTPQLLLDWEYALQNGRGGLGTIIVKAAGNNADNAQGDAANAVRSSIIVAAYDSDGDASWYTNRGANVLVSAPSSGYTVYYGSTGELTPESNLRIATTDRNGEFGYADDGWSSSTEISGFGGTSSAAPTVSGVVALMLEANPDLGWRDVQNILAYSAHYLGGEIGVKNTETETVPESWLVPGGDPDTYVTVPVEYFDWFYNGADNWNGGGLHFSEDYGYGGVDAYNAVRMAEAWTLFDDAQTSINEVVEDGLARVIIQDYPDDAYYLSYNAHGYDDGATVSASWTYTGSEIEIEYVNFSLQINLIYMEGMTLTLTSPEGTTITLMEPQINDYTPLFTFSLPPLIPTTPWPTDWSWTFGATAFKGEDPTGDWTFTINEVNSTYDMDNYGAELEGGEVRWFEFDFYGQIADADDVYHYTNEILSVLSDPSLDPVELASRISVEDLGGTDWFNFAAIQGDLVVDLSAGGTTTLDGALIAQTTVGTVIENVVTGDGNDTIIGNDAANELWGGRGDDLFVFYDDNGSDWVGDFEVGDMAGDTIALYGTGVLDYESLLMSELNGDTIIDLGDGDQITLAGLDSTDLVADDFLFFV